MKDLRIGVIGNMLGRNAGRITTQGQILSDLLEVEGVTVISASSKINRVFRLLDVIATLIKSRNSIDILVLEVYSGLNIVMTETVGIIGRLLGLPMIFVLHGGDLPQFAERHPRATKRVLSRANILAAPSSFLARVFREQGFDVRVVRNIVDLDGYPFRLRKMASPKLIWMRAFHEIYNPQLAIQAFCLIKRRRPEANLVMAGVDKGLEPEIKKLVDDLGLKESVRFPGFLDPSGKIREFSEADIFLNTNHIDNMPVSVVEACAMGLPVVATSVGGIPDLIRNGEEGLLVPDGDAEEMAQAVISLLENPELAERLSTNGRLLAERSAWQSVRPEWEKLFGEILQKKVQDLPVTASGQVSNL